MPRITSSSDRSKRSTKKPVTKGQNPQRANRQQMSQAKVTRGGKPQGARSLRTTMRAPVTSDANRPSGGKAPVTMGRGMAPMANAAKTLGTIRGMMTPAGMAASVMAPRPLASGTLKGKPTGAKQGPAVPKRLTQAGIDKGSFDDAFRNARKAGKKEFSWKGKRYNTKLRGE